MERKSVISSKIVGKTWINVSMKQIFTKFSPSHKFYQYIKSVRHDFYQRTSVSAHWWMRSNVYI